MKKTLILYILLLSLGTLQCQTFSKGFSSWWTELRGENQNQKKSPEHSEMKDSTDPNKKPYEKYEDDMDPHRVLRD